MAKWRPMMRTWSDAWIASIAPSPTWVAATDIALLHHHQARHKITTPMIVILHKAPTQDEETFLALIDIMIAMKTHAPTQGEESFIDMLVHMSVLNKTKPHTMTAIHMIAMRAHHKRDDQPHNNVKLNMDPPPHREPHMDAKDQGHQDQPRRDFRNHPRHNEHGRGDPTNAQDEIANNGHRQQPQQPRQDPRQHHHREPSEASVQLQHQPNAMVGRGRPPHPPQAARDEGVRPRVRNLEDEENMYGKLKFKGEDNAEAYFSWALKVEKIFHIHNYSGAKKVGMASLEFEDYASTWWEQVVTLREEEGEAPIDTWEEMNEEMQARFVPAHYMTELFNKLQKLKQGTKTVEELYKEMELTMMRANIQESENQTIARFFNGLNYPIKRIVEFQPYSNMVELVHQASKAERQVNEDIKYSKAKSYFASKLATTAPTTSAKPSIPSTTSKQATTKSRMKQPVTSTASSQASTRPSNVTFFKCGTQGHKSFECKNTEVMITMENCDIETLSEGEYEALVQAAVANEEDYDEESGEDPLLCVHDPSPSLVVTRVLTTQPKAIEDQRCNIFQTRVGIGGKSIKVIIDGGSCYNLAST
ncbi:hypothetical protein QYE76_009360 [Lolium multiflorum]|uniref:Retrotransposon gag domain-containing protein n=1 Tax=Lolium multiflorum TaxID=4521 RepID=A0AAD8TUW0_LOLMU|nr:hypothetical protein QYE76_009360 [Lolium multiflorum]